MSKHANFTLKFDDSSEVFTLYKDTLRVPSLPLADALVNELNQPNLPMPLFRAVSHAVRIQNSRGLKDQAQEQLLTLLENDPTCLHEDPRSQDDFKRALAHRQKE